MSTKIQFLVASLCFVVLLAVTVSGGSASSSSSLTTSVWDLLRGTGSEQLLADRGSESDLAFADKGFVPDFGNYFDNSTPGWGFDIQQLGGLIFAVWFTYNGDGTPTWFIIVGAPTDKGTAITGDINSFKWDPFGAPNAQATPTNRGTMTIAWSDESNADVTWTLDGDDGAASIAFAQFASGPAYADMTGHYFDAFASGWGFTLLTQGDVTVLTMYWYSGGQPVWAQGVSGALGFNQLFDLLLFNGPGLCPACLPRKGIGGGGPTTQFLDTVLVNWTPFYQYPGDSDVGAPVVNIQRKFAFKGGPLGPNPFGDIPLGIVPVTTQGVTSAYGDSFDSDYEWFLGPGKGGGCLQIQYDPGILTFPPAITGLQTGYVLLEPNDDGVLPAFIDAACVNPITINAFGGDPVPLGIRMGPLGEDGVSIAWETALLTLEGKTSPGNVTAHHKKKGQKENRGTSAGRRGTKGGRKVTGEDDKGTGTLYGYGGTAGGFSVLDTNLTFFPFPPFLVPPSSDSITNDPESGATIIISEP
jgi:hypothetical protein